MKYIPSVVLLLITVVYAFLFMATKRVLPCEGDCEKVSLADSRLRSGRESYILAVDRCLTYRVNDSLCIYVRDTTGIDWERLADTVCMTTTMVGLANQKIYIIKPGPDTVARRTCP